MSDDKYKGTCEVHGRIELRDFYYGGRYGWGDADTAKISMKTRAIRFRVNDTVDWKQYPKIFDNAYVNSEEYKVIHRGKMDVRLQGIDAPELHISFNSARLDLDLTAEQRERLERWDDIKFRQHQGARATYNAVELLKKYSRWDNNSRVRYVDGYVYSKVDTPNQLFDVYGRFVGDLIIQTSEGEINVNQKLVEDGWALPDFYNTMSNEEIARLYQKGKIAKSNGNGIWNGFSDTLITFDSNLTWDRDAPEINHEIDIGGFNIPKIFRRQVNYEVLNIEGIDRYESLKDFLSQGEDEYHITSEFLPDRENVIKHNLGKYIKESGKMNFQPGQVVFLEDSSPVLKDRNGETIAGWDHVQNS